MAVYKLLMDKLTRCLPEEQIQLIKDIVNSRENMSDNECFICTEQQQIYMKNGIVFYTKHKPIKFRIKEEYPLYICDKCNDLHIKKYLDKEGCLVNYTHLWVLLKIKGLSHVSSIN